MSYPSWPRAGVALMLGLALVSCGGDKVGPEGTVSFIEIAPKTARLYTVGQQQVFTNTITTEAGTAGEGIPVGYISRDPSLVQVNSTGIATAQKKGGSTYIVVSAGGKSDSAFVEVPTTTCGSVTPVAVTTGQVITDVGATGFCSAASSGEYAVIVQNKSLATSGTSSIEISGSAIGTPPAGSAGATFSKAVTSPFGLTRTMARDVAFEMRHRRAEATLDAMYGAGAKAWYDNRKRRASFSTAAPAVNDVMSINVQLGGTNDCTATPQLIDARVAAVSNSAIVLADPGNPSGGYTDDEYNNIAQMFDSIINPLDVANFGAPTDIDNNGHILLVFTKVINSKTPSGSSSFVGGLTHSRDLLPKSSCPGSNEAEMFYLLVPDSPPYTASNGNEFSKTFVNAVTDAGVVHEFQHLINFGRRRYLNPGAPQPSEEVWLNEGLSHTAEDLLFYRRSGRTPRTNFAGADINNQGIFDAWRFYVLGNFLNFDEYIAAPNTTSPIQAGDATGTRGATFAFLRYLADQNFTNATDGTFWYDLVNKGDAGIVNLEKRLGNISDATLQGMLRDFTISLFADDFVSGIPAKYTQPSWDMRSMYPRLAQIYGLNPATFYFPLTGVGLKDAETKTASLTAGGFQVYRFRGLSGTDSFIRVTGPSGSALPANITISVVRTAP